MNPGDVIGPYRVLARLGEGGMGEVYRARDEKLGREIALKILPVSVAADAGRLDRFAREARVLASLNHPYIGAIHGFEDATPTTPPALVLELVPGPTLEELLRSGPVSIQKALAFARQIAEALDAAHERGIVHRDLKPANIKITPGDTAKVLDFGIAKVLDDDGETAASARTVSATQLGTIIGSPPYMSPEQARGEAIDRRTDIWAFGCVVFEMISGVRAFPGATVPDAVASVLSREPDWTALPAATPPAIVRMLRRCLQKDVRWRLRDIGDARADIDDPLGSTGAAASARSGPGRTRLAWGLVAVLTASLLWTVAQTARRGAAPVPAVVRTSLLMPQGLTLVARDSSMPLAVSPDGSTIAFVVERDGRSELYTQRLSESKPVLLAADAVSIKPFFSPDGRWVAYATADTLFKVGAAGGTAIRICTLDPGFFGGAWGPDDTIVWASRGNANMSSVPAGGGAVRTIPGSEGAAWPEITPDGRTILFVTERGIAIARMPISGGPSTIVARLNREGEKQTVGPAVLGAGGTLAEFQIVSSGFLVYGQSPGIVMALPIDLKTLVPTGAPVPVADPVERGANSGAVYFAASRSGLLVYAPTGRQHRLVWVSRAGVETPLGAEAGDFRNPVLSPDDSSLVVGMNDETRRPQIWLYDAARGTRASLGLGLSLAWAPGGASIIGAAGGLVTIPLIPGAPRSTLVPTEELRKVLPSGTNGYPTSWSSDGRYVLFHADARQLWLADTETKQVRPLITDTSNAHHAAFSPDGRWIAYTSNASSRDQIWVRAFPSLAYATQVSLAGGTDPRWTKGGKEIVYREGDDVMSAAIDTSRQPVVGRPVRLFSGHYEGAGHSPEFAVTRDGQRFVMVKSDPASRLDHLSLVQHVFENLSHASQADNVHGSGDTLSGGIR
jgi:Tol biopolymer transport system component